MALLSQRPSKARPSGPEALIREARRLRRRRWAIGTFVLLVIAAAAAAIVVNDDSGRVSPSGSDARSGDSGAGAVGNSTSSAQQLGRIPYATEMGVLAPGEVWAADGFDVYLTENDGVTWRSLTAPGLEGDVVGHLESVVGIGSKDLWIASSMKHYGSCGHPARPSPTGGAYGTTVMAISTDGGYRWSETTLPNCADADQLTFTDARRGWALSEEFYGAKLPTSNGIYATTDGGQSWKLLGVPPFAGPIAFANPEDGWGVAGNAAGSDGGVPLAVGGSLYASTDGGVTWTKTALLHPATPGLARWAMRYGSPQFLSSEVGFIPVLFTSPDDHAARFGLEVTSNGGRSWSVHLAPGDPGIADYSAENSWPGLAVVVPWSVVDRADWFVYVGPKLYQTTDEGESWKAIVPRPVHLAPGIEKVTFTSPSNGWALFGLGTGGLRLGRTTDGGGVWRYAT
jgi:photosystem II stability/assembly factor-like uncharacterized protein